MSKPGTGSTALPSPDGGSGSQTIIRALAVLRALREAEADVRVTEVARRVALPSSTVHRILRTLVVAGYVVQSPDTDRYRLGTEAFLLGRSAGQALGFDAAMPLLEELAEVTGESANLVVRDHGQGLVVLRVESKQPLRFAQPTGARIPLYCTSSGKALLAFGADLDTVLARVGDLTPLTSNTITSSQRLREELRTVRAHRFSVNRSERILGVCGVAAPVLGSDGIAVAAVAVQGPESRMSEERIADLAPVVMRAAEAISVVLPRTHRI